MPLKANAQASIASSTPASKEARQNRGSDRLCSTHRSKQDFLTSESIRSIACSRFSVREFNIWRLQPPQHSPTRTARPCLCSL